jgi:hypothetical protein
MVVHSPDFATPRLALRLLVPLETMGWRGCGLMFAAIISVVFDILMKLKISPPQKSDGFARLGLTSFQVPLLSSNIF